MISPMEIFLAATALLIFGNILLRAKNREKLQLGFTILMLLGLMALVAYMLYSQMNSVEFDLIAVNPFSLFFMLILTAGVLLVNIVAFPYSKNHANFSLLTIFALLGMYLVASSNSLIGIFIGLELASMPPVFIILLERKTIEAAAKFFVMASVAIAIFSFASVVVYGATDSFALAHYQQSGILLFAAILFIASIGFDASIFPFNVLIPDVYQGAPAYVTSLLGGVNKKVGFAALLQVLILVFILDKTAFLIVAILSVLTMFYGNIVAIMQNNIKRMLAYSSISQAGYILIGIAVATTTGIGASLIQIFAHMFIFIGILSIVAWLELRNRVTIDEYIGLNDENRFAAFAISVFMLSLIGLPFTTGFVGKLFLFLSAINANLTWLAIIGVVNSIISIFYYVKVIMAMYTRKEGSRHITMNLSTVFVVVICLLITIILGMYPAPLINLANNASAYLIGS